MLVFYPHNRTEVDDGYWYAQGVRDDAYLNLFNPRFFLFLPVMKLLYQFMCFLHINIDAYTMMCIISMIFSGLTVILVYDTLAAQLDLGKKTSLFASLAVLISYEFWRYSYEAEVYVISLFLILIAFRWFMITKKQLDFRHVIGLAILCAIATLLYKPNFIPLFVVFPLIYMYFRKFKQLTVFYCIGAIIILGSFAIVYNFLPTEQTYLGYLFGGTNKPVGHAYMALFVIASNIVSVLWIFSSDHAVTFIRNEFPHKVIDEELFLARQIESIDIILWVCLGIMLLLLLFMVARAIIRKLVLTPYQKKATGTVIIWLAIYSTFLMFLDPSSNEPWLMVQIPIIILISILFVKPLKKTRLWLPYTLLLMLFVNNSIGGMWLLKDRRFDYNQEKSEWLRKNADKKDIIMSYGPISFIRYLRYTTDAQVIDIEEDPDVAYRILKEGNKSGYIYLTEDVLDPPEAIKYRSGGIINMYNEIYKNKGFNSTAIADGEFTTYRITSLK